MKPEKITRPRPAWMRQEGESYQDWSKRYRAENLAIIERQIAELPEPLDRLKAGGLGLAVGVGTYDCNGNPKGQGWW